MQAVTVLPGVLAADRPCCPEAEKGVCGSKDKKLPFSADEYHMMPAAGEQLYSTRAIVSATVTASACVTLVVASVNQ